MASQHPFSKAYPALDMSTYLNSVSLETPSSLEDPSNFHHQDVTSTPGSATTVLPTMANALPRSLQGSPAGFVGQDPIQQLVLAPFELSDSASPYDHSHTSPTSRESPTPSRSGGLIRKISQSARQTVSASTNRLRRKTSHNNTGIRDHSSGPVARRRSDSKTLSSNGTSQADTDSIGYEPWFNGDSSSTLPYQESIDQPAESEELHIRRPEGLAPTIPDDLIHGYLLMKVTKRRRKRLMFYLDVDGSRISWNAKLSKKYFSIDDIRGIRTGTDADHYRFELKCHDVDPSRWCTLLYADPTKPHQTKTIHLFANSQDWMKRWLTIVEALAKHREDLMTSMNGFLDDEDIFKLHWDREIAAAATSMAQKELLDLQAITDLCRRLHIHCPRSMVEEHFNAADENKVGLLNYLQFRNFMRRLKERQDILPIFQSLSKQSNLGLTRAEFTSFVEKEQKQIVEEDDFAHIIRASRKRRKLPLQGPDSEMHMDLEAFNSFLLSRKCHVYQPRKAGSKLDRPLNEYFISSSHNTYLLGRQVVGESSTEAYITALRRGCRCVEIDCWDGADGKPRVTHGHTKTTSIWFADCIQVIKRCAFDVSAYPVILSLEVHCNPEQQLAMVAILKEILGDMLVLEPLEKESKILPSPEDLKYKILVKVKSSTSHCNFTRDYASDKDLVTRLRSASSPNPPPVSPMLPVPSDLPSLSSTPTSQVDVSSTYQDRSMTITSASSTGEDSDTAQVLFTNANVPLTKVKPSKIIKQLSDLGVYLQGYRYRGFKTPEAHEFNHIFSLDEVKAMNICNHPEEKAQFIEHNMHYISRVYPRAGRFDSSNFTPTAFWRRGVQMVALNWQTHDANMEMNQAMFASDSDQSGYVLKPKYEAIESAHGSSSRRYKMPRHLIKFSITIISAQQLPRLASMTRDKGINPLIEVQMFSSDDRGKGMAKGSGGEEISANNGYSGIGSPYGRRSRVVMENGFNPRFNDHFELSLDTKYPDLVFVRWIVWHCPSGKFNNNCIQLATFTAKLSSLNEGYRHVPLFNGVGEEFIFSTLFCKITKSNSQPTELVIEDMSGKSAGKSRFRGGKS